MKGKDRKGKNKKEKGMGGKRGREKACHGRESKRMNDEKEMKGKCGKNIRKEGEKKRDKRKIKERKGRKRKWILSILFPFLFLFSFLIFPFFSLFIPHLPPPVQGVRHPHCCSTK